MIKLLTRFLSFLVFALLFGCTSVTPTAENLVGKWFGEDFQAVAKSKAKWLMNRRNDGTFHITFAIYDDNQKVKKMQTEEGTWSYRGGLYATVTTKIDEKFVDAGDDVYKDSYEIKEFSESGMKYLHLKSGQIFQSKRVADDFKLPE